MVVEAAFTDCDGSLPQESAEARDVTRCIERGRVVGMDTRAREYKTRVVVGDRCCRLRCLERLTNADNRDRARIAGAGDYLVAVAGERRVREVGVAVDED